MQHLLDSEWMDRFDLNDARRGRHLNHREKVDRCSGCRVQNLSLLDGPSFLPILELQLHKHTREYEPAIEIFTQNDDADRIFFIETGGVIVRYLTDDFRLITSKISHPGDVLGLADAWYNDRYTATATTVTAARIGELPATDLHNIASRHSDLRRRIETCLSVAHQHVTAQTSAWLANVTAAVRHAYDTLPQPEQTACVENVWHHLGDRRPRPSRQFSAALRILKERGTVLVNTPHLVIINPEALHKTAGHQEEPTR